ncbi:MAG: AMP-binding protein [Gemmatimonadetes bacterium]|nr:AMP-binding protein [Gemmatimonadota bacterium]
MKDDFLAEAAARWPERRALSDVTRSWSYAELDAWVTGLAARIREEDRPEVGDLMALVVDPTPEGIALMLAATRAGLAVAPLNPRLTEPERDTAIMSLAEAEPGSYAVLWTSGTEGQPRGVSISADNLRASADGAAKRLGLGPDDRWLASLSVAHVGGLALVTRSLLLGSEIVAVGLFDVTETSELMDGERFTHASFVPTQLMRLLRHRERRPPPPSFRCALIGGAHASGDLVAEALAANWPLALTYGMTEATSQVATADPDLVRAKPGSVGRPLDGVELRIDADGEILVRGPTLATGYVASGGRITDHRGWYHTGDLGKLDDERHLWVTGRRSSRVVSGGVTVDPSEVEEVLRRHPMVADVCVVGIPDAEWGEKVAAALVFREGDFDLESVDAMAREWLSPAKRPRRWLPLEALPVSANGKVDREAVRARLLPGPDAE